jgi:hypothetical protein
MQLLLMGLLASALVVGQAAYGNIKTAQVLHKRVQSVGFPRMISMLVVTAHLGELVRIIEHISVIHIVGALLLLALGAATSGHSHDNNDKHV